ncbi:T9SS type A sorting domain-containing protein [Litoribaculum gwangyangense]|uniref:Secretion system C-terminal sorting domain-containing protein n=1 Tax=Litoribaculum gwangyangense TaxID=1130722 RepID=A0ABP9CMW8_9FLAO
MKKITLLICLFVSFTWAQADLTVTVDVSEIDLGTGGMNIVHNYQNPAFQENAAVNNNDGTWSYTFTAVPFGQQIEYIWRAYWPANAFAGYNEALVPLVASKGLENDIAIDEPKNTDFFAFCNRIATGGTPPDTYYFESFRKPGVIYPEIAVTGTAGEFHYIRYSVNSFDINGGPGAVDNGDGTHTVRVRPSVGFEYLWNNQDTTTEENLIACANGGAAGPVNTDNFSFANRVHTAGINDRDEFNVCPEDEALVIDFETADTGAGWTWTVFENDPVNGYNVAGSIVANPVAGGINTSANVFQFTGDPTMEVWGRIGAESGHPAGNPSVTPSDLPAYTVDDTNNYMTMMVYQVGYSAPVRIKLAGVANASVGEVTSQNSTVADEWTKLTFDMSAYNTLGEQIDQIIILPSFAPSATARTIYIDNITFGAVPSGDCFDGIQNGDEEGVDCGGRCGNSCVIPAPLVSAPVSITPETDQKYIFSDEYTIPANKLDFNNPTWATVPPSNFGTSTAEVVSGTTDNIRYFTDVNLLFMPFTQFDAGAYNYFHIDIWSDTSTFAIVKLEGAGGPTFNGNVGVTLTPGQWTSVDIDLNTFGGLSNPGDRFGIFQLVIEATAGLDYYFDNIYFSKSAFTLSTKNFEVEGLKVYPNPSQDSWTVSTKNIKMNTIEVFDILGKNVMSLKPESTEVEIEASELTTGLYFARITTDEGSESLKLVKK